MIECRRISTSSCLAISATRASGRTLKSDDHDRGRSVVSLCRRSKQNVRFGDRTDTGTNNANLDLLGRKFFERSLEHLDRTLNVGLENDEKFLDLGLAERFDTTFGGLEHRRLTSVHLTLLAMSWARSTSATTWKVSPACGTPCKPRISTGVAGPASVTDLAAIREHRTNLARKLSDDKRIADSQRSLLNKCRRNRTAAFIEFGFEHNTGSTTRRARFQFENVGLKQNGFEQCVEIRLLFRRNREPFRSRRPNRPAAGQVRQGPVLPCPDSHPGLSILLIATMIGTPAAFECSTASIVCGMTPSSAATTRITMSVAFAPRARIIVNASWPGVSRNTTRRCSSGLSGVRDHHAVCTDVLRDSAGLAFGDIRRTDRVEQRGLTVIDVAHDRDDRCTRSIRRHQHQPRSALRIPAR